MRKTTRKDDVETLMLIRHLTEAYQNISRRDDQQSASWELGGSEFDVIATLGNTEGISTLAPPGVIRTEKVQA
jgi:hypothetical protein